MLTVLWVPHIERKVRDRHVVKVLLVVRDLHVVRVLLVVTDPHEAKNPHVAGDLQEA